jgi:hypothetical protein
VLTPCICCLKFFKKYNLFFLKIFLITFSF